MTRLIGNRPFIFFLSHFIMITGIASRVVSQPECMAWGNLTGIRLDGQLLDFETSLSVIGPSLMNVSQTAKEQQSPHYRLEGANQIITTRVDDISFVEVVEDLGDGRARLVVEAKAEADTIISGAFFCLDLPAKDFANAKIEFFDSTASTIEAIPVFAGHGGGRRGARSQQLSATGARFIAPQRQIEVRCDGPTEIIVARGNRFFGNGNTRVYFGVMPGAAKSGQSATKTFTFKVSVEIDKQPIQLHIDTTKPGRAFDGIGGNFRLQNPNLDPQVIDYCLENLNVTWGRVEMPWASWHPIESINPIEAARAGQVDPGVAEAMKMAQRLAKKGMPVIVSAWYPPAWAVVGPTGFGQQQGGLRGNPLNPDKMPSILKSITSYILYLKEAYGVEAAMFSFNESDLGINVRQTGEEHAELIKSLGAFMAAHGLVTKMLLGDNSDANTYSFITPAMENPETHKYIGAISFHSWRGCDNWTLSIWADAAKELNVPLLVGEGSTDAAAHRYPDIFLQPVYALNEIDTYVRIGAVCQARAILQWQLTSDYSVLTGAGVFNSDGELRPTQRFWNLKQLGLTPPGSFHLPTSCDRLNISAVAYGDVANGIYSIHLVNNGAQRQVTLTGLPASVRQLRLYVTDAKRGMAEGKTVAAENGSARFTLDTVSFTSLISMP